MRVLRLIALAGAFLLALACRGGRETKGSPVKPLIGISVLTMNNPYFVELAKAIETEAARKGFSTAVTAAEFDVARQKDQVSDSIVKHASAIVLCPADSKSISTAIADADRAGIPVFTADIGVLSSAVKIVTHVATDNEGGGRLAARTLAQAVGDGGKIAILSHTEVESAILRVRGFEEEIARLAKEERVRLSIAANLSGHGEKDRSFASAQDIIQAHPDITGIFAVNDPSAMGAVAAIEKAGIADKVRVVGFDGLPEGRNGVRDGKLYATMLQHPALMGAKVVDSISRFLSGEKVPPEVFIPATVYVKADAVKDSTLNEGGR